jgi:hypothetical protein
MARSTKKTVLRSLRLTEDLDAVIRKDAESRGVSVNALLSSILTKYAEWDRYTEKLGYITIAKSGWRMSLEAIPEGEVAALGAAVGSQNPREMTLYWFKRANADTFLAYLSLLSRYAKTLDVETEVEGDTVTVLVHHDFGPKHTLFLKHFLTEAVKTTVGVQPKVEAGRSSLVVRFQKR